MKKNLLNHYLQADFKSAEAQLSAYGLQKKPEQLHGIRVTIKRIKALLSFAAQVYGKKFPKNQADLLFAEAGTIRELGIVLGPMQKKLKLPANICILLEKEKKLLERSFLEKIPRQILMLRSFATQALLPASLPEKKLILHYFKKQKKQAEQLLTGKSRKSLHAYRRKIKRLLYVFGAMPEKIQGHLNFDPGKTDKLQEKIGRWHDTWMALHFLSEQRFLKSKDEVISELRKKEKKQWKALKR